MNNLVPKTFYFALLLYTSINVNDDNFPPVVAVVTNNSQLAVGHTASRQDQQQ